MNKYNVFALSQLIEKGLARKQELIENALTRLDASLEPITILEKFVYVVNTNNYDCYRFTYSINEGTVTFSEPKQFEIVNDLSGFDNKSKKIAKNIVEAIAENDENRVEYFKAQWLATERKKLELSNKLNLTIGTKSAYINNAKRVVNEAIKTVKGAKSLIRKGKKHSSLATLLKNGSITIQEAEQTNGFTNVSREQLIYSKVVEARKQAKALFESPVFNEYIKNIYEQNKNAQEAIEFIAENYQEIFTLSLAEQTELFYNILEACLNAKPNLNKVVEVALSIGKYAISKPTIAEDIQRFSELIGANQGNFHSRMQLIEASVDSGTYTKTDVKTLVSILEHITSQPSEQFSPEFIVEVRRALKKATEMLESNNIDDKLISNSVNLIAQFSTLKESFGKSDITDFPDELSDEEGKKRFKKKSEDYEVDPQTGFPKGAMEDLLGDEDSFEEDEQFDFKRKLALAKAKAKKEDSFEDEIPESDDEEIFDFKRKLALAKRAKAKKELEDDEFVELNGEEELEEIEPPSEEELKEFAKRKKDFDEIGSTSQDDDVIIEV